MLTDNDRRLLQLIADQIGAPDFELRLMARSLLALDAELRELCGRLTWPLDATGRYFPSGDAATGALGTVPGAVPDRK